MGAPARWLGVAAWWLDIAACTGATCSVAEVLEGASVGAGTNAGVGAGAGVGADVGGRGGGGAAYEGGFQRDCPVTELYLHRWRRKRIMRHES